MSERINLTELRQEAERFAALHHYDPEIPETIPPLSVLSVDELLALIDTAEAAIRIAANPIGDDVLVNPDDEFPQVPIFRSEIRRLRQTLNRYTHTP